MTTIKATNIVRHEGHVSREQRERQQGGLLWLTGLPSSGKSTIAYTVEHALVARGHLAYVLDGDNIRFGLNKNLGFSTEDRAENIRRIGEVGKLFVDGGFLTLASFVSPYRARPRRGAGPLWQRAISWKFSSVLRSKYAPSATPRASTKRHEPVKYPTLLVFQTPMRNLKTPNWSLKPTQQRLRRRPAQIIDLLESMGKIQPIQA